MSFRVVYEPEALKEFREAAVWYEAEKEGLGVRFVSAVDEVISTVASAPAQFSTVSLHVRRARVLRWPYSVFFIVHENLQLIKVIAVWHGGRNPAELKCRLK